MGVSVQTCLETLQTFLWRTFVKAKHQGTYLVLFGGREKRKKRQDQGAIKRANVSVALYRNACSIFFLPQTGEFAARSIFSGQKKWFYELKKQFGPQLNVSWTEPTKLSKFWVFNAHPNQLTASSISTSSCCRDNNCSDKKSCTRVLWHKLTRRSKETNEVSFFHLYLVCTLFQK